MGKIYVGGIGYKIILSTDVDLSTISSVSIKVEKPDGTNDTWDASVEGTATYGQISYTTVSGDLNKAGSYKLQAYAVFGDGSELHGETTNMYVNPLYS